MAKYSLPIKVAVFLTLLLLSEAAVISRQNDTSIATSLNVQTLQRRDEDPTSFAWVHRFAAIGDSFTAGIGSGAELGDMWNLEYDPDWFCSRYDQAYPMIVNDVIGPSIDEFEVC
jgi:hypothetical protein